MTLEELKAEAKNQGYSLSKKPVAYGRLKKCTCGCGRINRWPYSPAFHGITNTGCYCTRCRKSVSVVIEPRGNRSEAFRAVTEAWNSMIEKEAKNA